MKKLIALFLVCVLALAGCGKDAFAISISSLGVSSIPTNSITAHLLLHRPVLPV